MIATVTTSSDKTRQRGHALSTLSITAYRLPSGFLFVSIVTWPILSHHPTPTPLPVPSSFYTPGHVPSTVTYFFRLSQIYYIKSINRWLCCVCVFFTLAYRAPTKARLPIRSVVCWTAREKVNSPRQNERPSSIEKKQDRENKNTTTNNYTIGLTVTVCCHVFLGTSEYLVIISGHAI